MRIGFTRTTEKPCPCVNSESRLFCNKQSSIEKFPDDILNNCLPMNPLEITDINIHGQSLEHLEANVFDNFPNLQELALPLNNIKNIHKGAFSKLGKLKVLHLYGNNITNIEDGALDDLYQIDFIDFTGNPEVE